MSNPYLGQIEIFSFAYPPSGWALCAGQLLPIGQNRDLFAIIGTQFGGDGIKTFALPDLRGRTPMGEGGGGGLTPRRMGDKVGEPNHTLTIDETPYHTHNLQTVWDADTTKNVSTPAGDVVLAKAIAKDSVGAPLSMDIYVWNQGGPWVQMADTAISTIGGEAHDNMMPYLTLNVCIALQGPVPFPPPAP